MNGPKREVTFHFCNQTDGPHFYLLFCFIYIYINIHKFFLLFFSFFTKFVNLSKFPSR